jgi:glycosyltransferase involved in cell wall biosynthesis
VNRESTQARAAIVAARNEADSIEASVRALAAAMPGARIIVADDASDDGTADLAMAAGATVVSRGKPHGKGGNVTAAAQALLSEGDGPHGWDGTVLLCDADLGTSADQLLSLVEAVEEDRCDLAVAAFARREGGGFGLAVGYAHDKILELCGFDAQAPISGQRAMSAETLRRLLPFEAGWGMEMGMTVDAVRAGLRVEEIELELSHRATGRTLGGFLHRGAQMRDFRRTYRARRD